MAFTAGNVAVPASGGTPVLVYQAPVGVPSNVVLSGGNGIELLESASQAPSTGFLFDGTQGHVTLMGLIGSIYAVSGGSTTEVLNYAASNIA